MKKYYYCIISILLFSCVKNEKERNDEVDIVGKWNLSVYVDINGETHQSTYTIFGFYEQGFEFTFDNKFYPRYDPKNKFDTDVWQTDYNVDSGIYNINGNILTLSSGEISYDYNLKIIDQNTIQLSNINIEHNPWTGTWTLIKE